MVKLVFSSDSFKGSLSSEKTAELLTLAAKKVFKDCITVPLIIADGGEGTLDAVLRVKNGRKICVTVHDPLMKKINASYGVTDDGTAVIEMAQASGLTLIDMDKRDPLATSSFGTGELISMAVKAGYRKLIIGIGGSATNDGGMGAMRALGVRFLDRDKRELEGTGADLGQVSIIDMSGLIPEVSGTGITVMCDVTNPLCGPKGASRIFGPQKGADEKSVNNLEAGMNNYARVIKETFGTDPDMISGAGAAGGMGAALKLFLGAELRSGIETLLDLYGFDGIVKGADMIITGEGRLDGQSSGGKTVQGVGLRAQKAGVPCIAICGCLGEGFDKIKKYGITNIVTLVNDSISQEAAIEKAEEIYYQRAKGVLTDLRDTL